MGEAKEGGYSPHEAQQAYSAEEIASFKEGRLSELATCRAHSSSVRSVVFSPGGKTIISGSDDKTIKVWDAGVSSLTPLTPQPKSDCFCACGSIPGAQCKEGERAQRLRSLRGLLPRWQDHRVGLRRQDDQSLGCSDSGAQGREAERAQQPRVVRDLLARR